MNSTHVFLIVAATVAALPLAMLFHEERIFRRLERLLETEDENRD